MRRVGLYLSVMLPCIGLTSAVLATTPLTRFNLQFSSQLKESRSTKAFDDDLALARDIYNTGRSLDKETAIYYLDRAFGIADGNKLGYGLAEEITLELCKVDPDKSINYFRRLQALYLKSINDVPVRYREGLVKGYLDRNLLLIKYMLYENQVNTAISTAKASGLLAAKYNLKSEQVKFSRIEPLCEALRKANLAYSRTVTDLNKAPLDRSLQAKALRQVLAQPRLATELIGLKAKMRTTALKELAEILSKPVTQLNKDELAQVAMQYHAILTEDKWEKHPLIQKRSIPVFNALKSKNPAIYNELKLSHWTHTLNQNGKLASSDLQQALMGNTPSLKSNLAMRFDDAAKAIASNNTVGAKHGLKPDFVWNNSSSVYKTMINEAGTVQRDRNAWIKRELIGTRMNHEGFIDYVRNGQVHYKDGAMMLYGGEIFRVIVTGKLKDGGPKPPAAYATIRLTGKITRAKMTLTKVSSQSRERRPTLEIYMTECTWEVAQKLTTGKYQDKEERYVQEETSSQ